MHPGGQRAVSRSTCRCASVASAVPPPNRRAANECNLSIPQSLLPRSLPFPVPPSRGDHRGVTACEHEPPTDRRAADECSLSIPQSLFPRSLPIPRPPSRADHRGAQPADTRRHRTAAPPTNPIPQSLNPCSLDPSHARPLFQGGPQGGRDRRTRMAAGPRHVGLFSAYL